MAQPPPPASPAGSLQPRPGEQAAPAPQQQLGGAAPGGPGAHRGRQHGKRRRSLRERLGNLFGNRRDERQQAVQAPAPGSAPPPAPEHYVPQDPYALLPTALASLALRDLTLVEALLRTVEKMEEHEEDPEQLDSLFRIDHLATRMRRNGENLLVLAGQDSGQQKYEPTPLLDVVRAGISEIADYNRALVGALPSVRVAGVASDDISHLLAELLDNATSKSPQQAQVTVSGQLIAGDAVALSVEDSGIGVPAERLAELNARLAGPPVLDVAVTRHMGLYVVARLAHRHGIRVQLQVRPFGGIAAHVVLPPYLVQASPSTMAARFLQEDSGPQPAVAYQGHAPNGQAPPPAGWHPQAASEGMTPAAPPAAAGLPPTAQPVQEPAAPPAPPAPPAQEPVAPPAQPGQPGQEPAAQQAPAAPPRVQPEPEGNAPRQAPGLPRRTPGAHTSQGASSPGHASGLPRRTPGTHAPQGSAVATTSQQPAPPPQQVNTSKADRILDDLDGFQTGERAASQDVPASGSGDETQATDDEKETGQS